jgi:hypothetical protein
MTPTAKTVKDKVTLKTPSDKTPQEIVYEDEEEDDVGEDEIGEEVFVTGGCLQLSTTDC